MRQRELRTSLRVSTLRQRRRPAGAARRQQVRRRAAVVGRRRGPQRRAGQTAAPARLWFWALSGFGRSAARLSLADACTEKKARKHRAAGCALSLCVRVRRPSLPGDDCSISWSRAPASPRKSNPMGPRRGYHGWAGLLLNTRERVEIARPRPHAPPRAQQRRVWGLLALQHRTTL